MGSWRPHLVSSPGGEAAGAWIAGVCPGGTEDGTRDMWTHSVPSSGHCKINRRSAKFRFEQLPHLQTAVWGAVLQRALDGRAWPRGGGTVTGQPFEQCSQGWASAACTRGDTSGDAWNVA